MSSSSPRSERNRTEVLPPLREAVPEMDSARPDPSHQYTRTLDTSPVGPTSRTGVSGLAPSPLVSSSSRSRPQSGTFLSQGSSSSRTPTTRSSPAIPSVQSVSRDYREPRNLPPISTYGDAMRSSDPRYAPSPQSARYPSQSYVGMPAPDYGSAYGSRPSYPSPSAGPSYPLNFDNLSDYGDGKQKRRRGNLPKQVTDILRGWFTDHIAHPYPTEDEKVGLMQMTGLSMSQISNWFINARRRNLPQMTRQAQAEQELRDNQSSMIQMSQTNR